MTANPDSIGKANRIDIAAAQRPIAFARKLGALLEEAGLHTEAQNAKAYIDETYASLRARIVAGDAHVLGREHFDAVAVQLGYTRSVAGIAFNGCVSPLNRNRRYGNGDIKPTAGLFGLDYETITNIIRPVKRDINSLGIYPDEISQTNNRVGYDNAEHYGIPNTNLVSFVEAVKPRYTHEKSAEICVVTLGELILS